MAAPAQPGASERPGAIRASLRVGPEGVQVVSAYFSNELPSRDPVEDPIGVLQVVDSRGKPLASTPIPRPERVSIIHEEGGGEAATSPLVSVVVEWPEGAHAVTDGSVEVVPAPPPIAPLSSESVATAVAGASLSQTASGAVAIHESGPSDRRFDFVVVGDNYGPTDQAQFLSDVSQFSQALLGTEPYASFQHLVNVWAVPVVSGSSPALGCAHNCFGSARLICCDSSAALSAGRGAVSDAESVLILMNDPNYGGSGGEVPVSYNGPNMNRVMLHELGHSLGLHDEYVYSGEASDPSRPQERGPNCSSNASLWSHWMDEPGVGAFTGCSFPDLVRPTDSDCLMKTVGHSTYCPVCREYVTLKLYEALGGLVESASPEVDAGDELEVGSSPITFEITANTTGEAIYEWQLDFGDTGVTEPRYSAEVCELQDAGRVEVSVTDQTEFVRNDPRGYLTDSYLWTLAPVDDDARVACLPTCIGQLCSEAERCDDMLVCGVDTGGAEVWCVVEGQSCGANGDCCGEMQCTDNRCECQAVGQPCASGRDCCGGAFCDEGVCSGG
ncbi:MAG: M64 family metallopeptidase [Myxococcota bacterium]